MRKKVIAIILAGGLMLGMCGCGSDRSTASTLQELEETNSQDEVESTEDDSQELEIEEVDDGTAYDDQTETEDAEESEETVVTPNEEDSANDIDLSTLLTEHVLEYEDYDGYQIRNTLQISPIFREDDSETMYALWETLGNDLADFPSKDSFIEANHALRGWNKFEYIIGTFSIENITDGFPIASNNQREYNGILKAEDNENNAADQFNITSASATVYPNGSTTYYKSDFRVFVGKTKLTSDTWGPNAFVIALPNKYTPNEPDGYRYDELSITFSYNEYGSPNRPKYETLTLEYFE